MKWKPGDRHTCSLNLIVRPSFVGFGHRIVVHAHLSSMWHIWGSTAFIATASLIVPPGFASCTKKPRSPSTWGWSRGTKGRSTATLAHPKLSPTCCLHGNLRVAQGRRVVGKQKVERRIEIMNDGALLEREMAELWKRVLLRVGLGFPVVERCEA
jgi:hypothetical protein